VDEIPAGEAGSQWRHEFNPDAFLIEHPGIEFTPFSIEEPERVSADQLDSEIDRDERKALIKLRHYYARGLLYMLVAQLVFMNVVLVLSGIHALTISPSTMKFYLTGTLGEIFGVVTVAVRFLFSDKKFLGHHDDA